MAGRRKCHLHIHLLRGGILIISRLQAVPAYFLIYTYQVNGMLTVVSELMRNIAIRTACCSQTIYAMKYLQARLDNVTGVKSRLS